MARPDFQALRQAVHDDLDSDAPRLVLADALQQVGDPRGELIAVQCELARLGAEHVRLALWERGSGRFTVGARASFSSADHDRVGWIRDALATGDPSHVATLRETEDRLLFEHGSQWAESMTLPCFERGFVTHVNGGATRSTSSLFERVATLESLALRIDSDGAVLAEPRLRQLRQLRLSFAATGNQANALGHCSRLTGLRQLAFSGLDTQDHPHDLVFPRAVRASLEALELWRPRHPTLYRLADEAPALRHLALAHTGDRIGDALSRFSDRLDILEILTASPDLATVVPSLTRLRALRFQEAVVDELAVRAVASNLPALRILDLARVPFTRHVQDLVGGSGLQALTHLRMVGCSIDDNALDYFLRSPLATRLQLLDLSSNRITGASVPRLAELRQLHTLVLNFNRLHDDLERLRGLLPTTRVLFVG